MDEGVSKVGQDYARLRELAEKATPGPWQVVTDLPALAIRSAGRSSIVQTPNQNAWNRYGRSDNWHGVHGEANAAFIAAACPATVLQLLADNERMREALDEIADLAALSVVGGDDFDRGARAARLEAAEIARAAVRCMIVSCGLDSASPTEVGSHDQAARVLGSTGRPR